MDSRSEWNDRENDRAHAELSKRVDDLSGEFNILRKLPWDLAQALERDRDRTDEAFREADRTEVRRISDLRAYVDGRLAEQPAPKIPWKTIIAFAGTVIVPVVIAILGWAITQGSA